VQRWLLRHVRFRLHFTPTYSSWINQVERWFGLLTQRQIRRGSHQSVRALEDAIRLYLKANNEKPKPFTWVKTADEILASIARFCVATSEAGHQCPVSKDSNRMTRWRLQFDVAVRYQRSP
jgi:hypothetical protein